MGTSHLHRYDSLLLPTYTCFTRSSRYELTCFVAREC